jgi:hypothetical protein
MRRRLIITTVWAAGTIVAIALSVSAVGMVGRRVAGRNTTLVSPARVEQALAETTTTTDAPDVTDDSVTLPDESEPSPDASNTGVSEDAAPGKAAAPPSTAGSVEPDTGDGGALSSPPSGVDEVYVMSGGTVAVRCTGITISLLYATPAPGWITHGAATTGPVEVEVRFEPAEDAHGDEARVKVTCQAGVPVEEIRDSN